LAALAIASTASAPALVTGGAVDIEAGSPFGR
jgi:hypothetical protein